jgi:hypothetical protein
MRRLTLFILLVFAVGSMAQIKLSGRKPAQINGHVPSKWCGIDTDFGAALEEDVWSPASGAITFMDSVTASGVYQYPSIKRIPNTRTIILMYSDSDWDRHMETRMISESPDTIGPVIDSWEFIADPDANDPIAYSEIFPMQESGKFLVMTQHSGNNEIPGYGEGESVLLLLFTMSITNGGVMTKTGIDSLVIPNINVYDGTPPPNFKNGFSGCFVRDSLFALFYNMYTTGVENKYIRYCSIVATSDTIYQNQDTQASAIGGNSYHSFDSFVHSDHSDAGDNTAVICLAGYATAVTGNKYAFKTFMTPADTLSATNDIWGYTTVSDEMDHGCHIDGGAYYAIYDPLDNVTTTAPRFYVMTGDTTSQAMTKTAVDYWILSSYEQGNCDIAYVQNSDSLLFGVHYYNNNLYSLVVTMDPDNGSIYESLIDSDTFTLGTSLNYPALEYIRDGLFVTATGDATGGTIVLYGMD